MRKKIRQTLFLLILVTLLASCALPPETDSAVDIDAIVATVAAKWETQQVLLAGATGTPTAEATATTAAEPPPTATPAPVLPVINPSETALDLQSALVSVYERANPSVVSIVVPPVGSGTGFVYGEDGTIVTNNHVVSGGNSYEVVFSDGTRREAELVGADVDSDLAVLKVDALPEGVAPLPLASGEELQVGQFVVAIGSPFGEEGSMSMGIISALGRSLTSQRNLGTTGAYSLPEVIQTDAPINPGNSGGPLLNLQGEVVGINSAIATATGLNSGVGFAIPVQAVRQIVPSLIAEGRYTYSYMGATFYEALSLEAQEAFGLSQTQGAYVVGVAAGSPAEAGGLIAADSATGQGGDLVIAIDGQPIVDFSDMNSYLVFHTQPGQTIELTVLRGGEEIVLPLTLGARP